MDPSGRRARIARRMIVTLVVLLAGCMVLLITAVSVTSRVPPNTVGPRLRVDSPAPAVSRR